MNVALSIAGCMLLVMAPNVAAPAVISNRRDIPVVNITRLLFGVSVRVAQRWVASVSCLSCLSTSCFPLALPVAWRGAPWRGVVGVLWRLVVGVYRLPLSD